MSSARTLAELIAPAANQDALSITYIDSGTHENTITVAELRQRALGILWHLQQDGLKPGDELVLFTNDQEQFIDAFWACILGGMVPVPVAVGISDDHRHKLLNIYSSLASGYLFTARGLARRLQTFAADHGLDQQVEQMLNRTVYVDQIEDISTPGKAHNVQPDDTAFIQFSSGSTSAPKGVVLTHDNVLSNIRSIIKAADFSPKDRSLSWMPLTHDMGLIGFHLNMLAAGVTQCIMETSLFVRRPLLWLEKASEKQATVLCSPNFGYKHVLKLLASKGMPPVDLSTVRLVFNGAEPISVELATTFMNTLAPTGLKAEAMYFVYGLAEASLAVSFPVPGAPMGSVTVHRHSLNTGSRVERASTDQDDALTLAMLGRAIPGTSLKIVDDQGAEVNEEHVGHVLIKGANVTRGYYRGENSQAFIDDGWLHTGDLGFITSGELVITGRSKDLMFVNGQNYYPQDLEQLVHPLPGLELGKVAVAGTTGPESGDDQVLVFMVHKGDLGGFTETARAIGHVINSQCGLDVHQVIPVTRMPKTTSGKVQRHRLVNDYLDGRFTEILTQLNALQSQSADDPADVGNKLEATLHSICNEIVIDRQVGLDDNLFDIGVSSLALAQIHERIEELHPGQLDIVDVFDYPSIRELAAFLKAKMASG